MRYYIISGFPGVGKTYAYKWLYDYAKNNNLDWVIHDTDSSDYSHIINKDGLKEINPEFPNNYMEAIKQKIITANDSDCDKCIIFVSTHDVVREALHDNGFKVTIIYPPTSARDIYLQRYEQRMSPQPLIDKIKDNYVKWIEEIQNENYDNVHKYQLEDDQYLGSIVLYLLNEEGDIYE